MQGNLISRLRRIKEKVMRRGASGKSIETDPILLRLVILFFTGITILSCSDSFYERDIELEKTFSKHIEIAENNNHSNINLNHIFGNDWRKICILRPYTLQIGFEEETKEKVTKYKILSDDSFNAVWIFYKNGSYRHLMMPRFMQIDDSTQQPECTTFQFHLLYIKHENGTTKFYFEN